MASRGSAGLEASLNRLALAESRRGTESRHGHNSEVSGAERPPPPDTRGRSSSRAQSSQHGGRGEATRGSSRPPTAQSTRHGEVRRDSVRSSSRPPIAQSTVRGGTRRLELVRSSIRPPTSQSTRHGEGRRGESARSSSRPPTSESTVRGSSRHTEASRTATGRTSHAGETARTTGTSVGEASAGGSGPAGASRHNGSSYALLNFADFEEPFAQGAFRWVGRSVYQDGPRKGQLAVFKWFKSGHVMEETYFELDIKAVDKALEFVTKFNAKSIIDTPIRINRPDVWVINAVTTLDTRPKFRRGHRVLVEPFIQGYQKFNSNSGWTNKSGDAWGDVMQALSHFSYHDSKGKYLLCDIQGGIYRNSVVLSDPVIMSTKNRKYGLTDLGIDGIKTFFSLHKCNKYCQSHWQKPANPVAVMESVASTTMTPLHSMDTRYSRPAESMIG